jgi:Ca-activated chloride channel family protein
MVSEETDLQPPPTRLLKAMSQLTLYRMQERANQYLAEGQLDDASRHLHNLATHLFSQGQHELARTTLQEAENIDQHLGLSNAGKKQIKYGTRALLLPSNLPISDEFDSEQGSTS